MENKNHKLEYEVIYDDGDGDDAYYMELRRQILLLTADDDEDSEQQAKFAKSIAESKRGLSRLTSYSSNGNYFPWCEGDNNRNYNYNSVPTWLVNLWGSRTTNGTGVFIPQIVKSRRRYKPSGKMNNEKTRTYRAKNQSRQ